MSMRTLISSTPWFAGLLLACAACSGGGDSAQASRRTAAHLDGATYDVTSETLVSSGATREFLLSVPSAAPADALPLVIALHWDGGSPMAIRAALDLETQAGGAAVFVYLRAAGAEFPYWDLAGRGKEAAFVKDVIASLAAKGLVQTDHVFITGMSGGATMTNAIGCALGSGTIRGIVPMSGTLYDIGGTYAVMPDGTAVTACDDPAVELIWGQDDHGDGTSFSTDGVSTRDLHLGLQACAATTHPSDPAPCGAYDGCSNDVRWCAIPGMGHQVWANAGAAVWAFVVSLP